MKRSKTLSKKRAFTLVEILIAIAVIMILFIVLISKVGTSTDSARKSGVQTDIRSFQVALHQVGIEQSEFSSDLFILSEQLNINLDEELMVYVEETKLKSRGTDPWGTEYELRYTQPSQTKGQIVIISAGPDTIFDTKDDIASVVTYYEAANGSGEHIVIEDNYSSDNNQEHTCSFVHAIQTDQYLNTAGNCKNPATYFYSCSCGAKGATTFNGNKDTSIHINDTRAEYLNVNEEEHKKNTVCNGCSKSLNTITESCIFENNKCIYCNGIGHIHDYKNIADVSFKKENPTCISGTIYYKSCDCCITSQDTFTADDALGHDYIGTVTQAATCTNAGTCKYSCSRCSSNYTQSIAQSPHSFAKIERNDMIKAQATCVTPTIYYYSCSYCNEKGADTFEASNQQTNPTNHVGTSITKYVELNDTHHIVASQCSSCKSDEYYISSTMAEHVFNGENRCLLCPTHVCKYIRENTGSLKASATCTSKAVYYYQCIGCPNYSTTDTFEFGEMKPHYYNKEVVNDKYIKTVATCNSKAIYYKSCQCGEQSTQDDIFYFGNFDETNHINENFKNRYDYVSEQSHLLTIVCEDCNGDVDYYPEQHSFDAANDCTLCKKHVHSFTRELANNSTLKTAATCTSKAVYYYSCIGCDEQTSATFEYGNLLDHIYNQRIEQLEYFVTKATCRTGTKYYYSCKCGAMGSTTFTNNERIPENHEGIEGYVGSELVHSKYTCCQVENNSHDNIFTKTILVVATCTTKGTSKYTCDCGYSYVENDIDALGHAEVQHSGQSATCTANGYQDYVTCSRCSYTTYEVINALGHNFNNKVATSEYQKSSANCINKAVYYYSCSNCGLSSKNQIGESMFEFGDYALSVHSIVEKNGTADQHSYCEWCNTKLSSAHIYNESIAVNPTCTSMGSTKYSCECGYHYTVQDIDAVGHVDNDNNDKCDYCGIILKVVDGLGDVVIGGTEDDDVKVEYDPDNGNVTVIPPEPTEPEVPPTIPEEKLPDLFEFGYGEFTSNTTYTPGTYIDVPYEYTYTRIKYPASYISRVWSGWTITKDPEGNVIDTVARDIQLSDIDEVYSTYIVYRFTNENALELNGVLGGSVNIYTFIVSTQDTLDEAIYLAAYLNISNNMSEYHVAKLVNGVYTPQNVDNQIAQVDSIMESYTVKGTNRVLVSEPSTSVDYIYVPSGTLYAEVGMTWNEWWNSNYNTFGADKPVLKTSDFEDVSWYDVIDPDMEYGFLYTLSGKWSLNETVNFKGITNGSKHYVSFKSNNRTYDYFYFDTSNKYLYYCKTSNPVRNDTVIGALGLYSQYQVVDFGDIPQAVSKDFYIWLHENYQQYILSSTWQFNETVNLNVGEIVVDNIKITTYRWYDYVIEYNSISINSDGIYFDNDLVYSYNAEKGNMMWIYEDIRSIDFGNSYEQIYESNKEFYSWLVLNARPFMEIQGIYEFGNQIPWYLWTDDSDVYYDIRFKVIMDRQDILFKYIYIMDSCHLFAITEDDYEWCLFVDEFEDGTDQYYSVPTIWWIEEKQLIAPKLYDFIMNYATKLESLTIDGTLYYYEEGMTWEEWCNSKYNTMGLYVDDQTSHIYYSDYQTVHKNQGAGYYIVKKTETISTEINYTIEINGSGN